jgi:nucleoside-diphosphate-sugar epimerase
VRVLVTGNLGYVGAVLTPLLETAGHTVAGLDVDLYRACSFPAGAALPQVHTRARDVRDVEPADFAGFDAVIHLAGLANEPLGEIDPNLTADVNHRATVRVAECARRAGVGRLLFASSCSVYGASGEGTVDEGSPPQPLTAYGRSKLAAEADLARIASDDFRVVSLRCGTVYGGSPRLRFDLVVNNLVAWACATGKIHLKSDGSAWRPLIHVEDVARVYVALLDAPRSAWADGILNVGIDADNFRIRDLAAMIVEAVPGSEVAFADGAERDRRSYRVSSSRLRCTLPDFKPLWSVGRGASQIAELLARFPVAPDDFEGSTYQRQAHVAARIASGTIGRDLRPVPATAI